MLSDRDIARWRLRTQHLVAPHATGAAGAVAHLLAVQAENPSQSAWAVAARTTAPDRDDLAGLLASGAVLRTHVLRSTWHYVMADDVAWLTDLTTPRLWGVFGDRIPTLHAEADAVRATLAGRHLDRSAIADRLTEGGWELSSRDLMLLMAYLEMRARSAVDLPSAGPTPTRCSPTG